MARFVLQRNAILAVVAALPHYFIDVVSSMTDLVALATLIADALEPIKEACTLAQASSGSSFFALRAVCHCAHLSDGWRGQVFAGARRS
jgi:hypothetical protein